MFGFLPSWASDLMLILAFLTGPSGLVWLFLQNKGANRKLEVEEGTLKKSEFDSITEKYQELYENASKELSGAVDKITYYSDELEKVKDLLRALRSLFRKVLVRNGVVLTAEEEAEFERTRPRPTRRPK